MSRIPLFSLILLTTQVFAQPLDFTGRWSADSSDVIYMDQRGQVPCASGVDITIDQKSDSFDLRVAYDCGVAPGGDHAIPYFMRGWRPLEISDGQLLLDGSRVGSIEDNEISFKPATTSGFPTIEVTVRFWSDSLHPQWLFFETLTRVNGMDVRYLKAHLNRH